MAIFRFFKMDAAAVLDFQKSGNCRGGKGQDSQIASPSQIASRSVILLLRYGDFLFFFQDGGRPPSWICDECVWTTHEGHLVVFITVQNLVGIDAVVLIICVFFDFSSFAGKRLFTPPKLFFGRI